MILMPFLGALAGAVIGAVVWAVLAVATGYEIGWIAWGVGLLVGFASFKAGGSGKANGFVCAALALLAIFCGKMMSVSHFVNSELADATAGTFTQEAYQEVLQEADRFAQLTSPSQHAQFMVNNGYTEAATPQAVTPLELQEFAQYTVPYLQETKNNPPPFETWKQEREQLVSAYAQTAPIMQFTIESLNLIDVLFAFLGISTAFKVGCGREEA